MKQGVIRVVSVELRREHELCATLFEFVLGIRWWCDNKLGSNSQLRRVLLFITIFGFRVAQSGPSVTYLSNEQLKLFFIIAHFAKAAAYNKSAGSFLCNLHRDKLFLLSNTLWGKLTGTLWFLLFRASLKRTVKTNHSVMDSVPPYLY